MAEPNFPSARRDKRRAGFAPGLVSDLRTYRNALLLAVEWKVPYWFVLAILKAL